MCTHKHACARTPQVLEHLQLNDEGQQLPLIYFDDFWLLRDKLVPMNESVESLPLYLAVGPKNFMWMQLQQQARAAPGHRQGKGGALLHSGLAA
jgi:Cleft lip and palate transmembrane protein 1 (CLPTM1)